MTRPLLFVTSNERKIREAKHATAKYGIDIIVRPNKADEIQHQEPAEVTKAKAKAVYANLQQPVVVQDTSWSIPALGGFPGPYMKDVATWLTAEDWIHMMGRHDDMTIIQHEHIVYYDGENVYHFSADAPGRLITEPRGKGVGLSSDQVIVMGDSRHTLAEVLDLGLVSSRGDSGLKHWYDFLDWYSEQ